MTKKLADGCYHVFLDVGSNIGNHVRFLYESDLYPKAKVAKAFFAEAFGPSSSSSLSDGESNGGRDNRDVCVFGFEPNPDHSTRHARLREAYAGRGWNYLPINAGVGHQYGNLTFYHTGDDLGFTSKQSSCRKRCDPVNVPVIRLSDWIKREVEGRKIPEYRHEKNNNTYTAIPPRVVMKMDIEMMEYEVFPDLMLSGALCNNIHSVIGEFHMAGNIAYLWQEGINFTSHDGGGVWQLPREKARQISEEWIRMIVHSPNCKTKISMEDDESYRNDGQPLPVIV